MYHMPYYILYVYTMYNCILTLHLLPVLSMVCFKQKKYRQSIDVATRAIAIDPLNVKALYRRAVGYKQLADYDKSKADLKDALKVDPNNASCKKELLAIKKELDEANSNQKKALAKAFSGSFLYQDKEEEIKQKQEATKREKEEQEELQKKRKIEWEDDCVKRMANNQPAISYEDWEKEKEDERKRLQQEEAKTKKQERRLQKQAEKTDNSDNDDDELTEQELALMKGYKKTRDGRVTSYFTRELDDHEKKKIGDIAPKKLDSPSNQLHHNIGNGNNSSSSPTRIDGPSEVASKPSKWNYAGTWEEKNCTAWCREQLEKRLEEVRASKPHDCEITSVEELTGEASVAIAGGKKRYIFDFHAKLKYKIMHSDGDKELATGTVRLPDICSTSHEELEVSFESWSNKPKPEYETGAMESRKALAHSIRESVQQWVQDFNDAY
jgi:Activator of Hsp90 ATPase, N-terminal/Tetratricopeptide repeat